MSVLKVIEIMADSPVSWEDATRNAVKKASSSVKGIKSVWIKAAELLGEQEGQDHIVSCDHQDHLRSRRIGLPENVAPKPGPVWSASRQHGVSYKRKKA